MWNRNFLMSLLFLSATMSLAPIFVQADHGSLARTYRCVVDTDIQSPDSLARGDFDQQSSAPLADVTLTADSDFAHQVLSFVKSENNEGAPATSSLELTVNREDDQIRALVETVISGPGLQKEQVQMSVEFKDGVDPQFITHGFVSRDAGISQQTVTKRKRFFGLGWEKTTVTSEELKFSDAAFFDPLSGIDLQCALVTGKN